MASNNNGDLSLSDIKGPDVKKTIKKAKGKVDQLTGKIKSKIKSKIKKEIKKKIKEEIKKKAEEEAAKKLAKEAAEKGGEQVVTQAGEQMAQAGEQVVTQAGEQMVAQAAGEQVVTQAGEQMVAQAGEQVVTQATTQAAAQGGTVLAEGATTATAEGAGAGFIAFIADGGWIILAVILGIILIFLLILFIMGLINVIGYYTQSNRYKEETQTNKIIYLGSDGKYNINDGIIDTVLKDFEGKDLEGTKKLFNKYVKAEAVTMFPKLPNGFLFWGNNEVNGKIIIKRQTGDEVKTLEYKEYDELKKMVDKNDNDAMKYFSLCPDSETQDLKLMIPIKDTDIQRYDEKGKKVSDNDSGVEIKFDNEENGGLDYQALIEPYCFPFEFFLGMHYATGDVKFMDALVEEVLKNDEQIVLTYVENTKKTTITYSSVGEGTNRYYETIRPVVVNDGRITYEGEDVKDPEFKDVTTEFEGEDAYKYKMRKYWKETEIIYSGTLHVTKANTWMKEISKNVNSEEKNLPISENTIEKEYTSEPMLVEEKIINATSGMRTQRRGWNTGTYNEHKISGGTRTLHTVVTDKEQDKTNDIRAFLNEYTTVLENLIKSPNKLYMFLNDERTQHLLEVMEYVLTDSSDPYIIPEDKGDVLDEDLEEFGE